MVIVKLSGGIGNQFFQYAVGRCIAHKLNTELKLDQSKIKVSNDLKPEGHRYYRLNAFNIQENFATPEEIKHVSENGIVPPPLPSLEDCKQDILIQGFWMMMNEKYYEDIIDIIRKEFTLKNPLSSSATAWKQKILSAECSVSMHFRHGDYIYNPKFKNEIWASILPLDYYYTCINILKQRYKRFTLFVFSDNLQWCKENLRLDVPTEFVSVTGAMQDDEELYLMSICNHNILANSTFSHFAASMNSHADKKVLYPQASDAQTVQQYLHWLKTNTTLLLDRATWIAIPFDYFNQPTVEICPYFSILLVVNNDIETVADTLNSIIGQDYKYFELIIIDNASTDGSGKICREVAKAHDNVTLIKLHGKISNGAAWNKAFDIAQGYYVMFLKSGDKIFPDALTSMYIDNEYITVADVSNSTVWLKENVDGDIEIADKKFVMKKISAFQNFQGVFHDKLDKQTLLRVMVNNETFPPLGTRIFKRKFILEHGIKFNEKIGDDAEALFTLDAMFQTDEIIFTPNIFYVAPSDET